jgi:hypothetical protein
MLICSALVAAVLAAAASQSAVGSAPLPVPSFRPSPGWWMLSTGPTDGRR